MAAPRRRNLLGRRRRVDEEGEEEGSVATDLLDDSQSEATAPSDIDADADADDSDLSDVEESDLLTHKKEAGVKPNGIQRVPPEPSAVEPADGPVLVTSQNGTAFAPVGDTTAMLNGLKISDAPPQSDAVDFDAAGEDNAAERVDHAAETQPVSGRLETPAERRRREHEEYKKKRDSDPAFIPNRGAFFMHDQRSANAAQNGFRPFGRGRGGRGRVGPGGPFTTSSPAPPPPEVTDGPWQHDLHQTLVEDQAQQQQSVAQAANTDTTSHAPPIADTTHSSRSMPPVNKPTGPIRSFSRTVQTGNVQVRVSLVGMKAPIIFSGVPVRQHTKLPNHRPPLRRDKPVRISLPEHPPRYIFPAVERSFIFIPRALRPNQQGFGRGRGRTGFGSYGGFSSRRTSVYGGSVYSPSIPMSRRSSMAREIGREGIASPSGSIMSRHHGGPHEAVKPVVRLPPGSQPPYMGHGSVQSLTSPMMGHTMMNPSQGLPTHPLPQKPTFRENWPTQIPMHQPRPQKTVSVAGIESPASMTFHAPQPQEQQPFHQQVPAHLNGNASGGAEAAPFFPHSRQLSMHGQVPGGTPLSNIPERAIHAQPFQPFQPGGFLGQPYPPQPTYYYPPAGPGGQPHYVAGIPPGAVVPMFVPGPQQGAYVLPTMAPAMAPSSAPSTGPPHPSMVAHETNGMVYYYDPSQVFNPMEGYAPASYAIPGMGGMMTPSPEGYYYPQVPPAGTVFYQSQ